jgi:hypothetical protein
VKHLFACEFCHGWSHGFDSPKDCREHEAKCDANPKNRTCVTCRHIEHDERCVTRKVRPKCVAWGDRQYRANCILWEEKTNPKQA